MKLINIGFGNLVSSDKLVAVVAPDSAPVKRSCETIQNRAEESEEKDD